MITLTLISIIALVSIWGFNNAKVFNALAYNRWRFYTLYTAAFVHVDAQHLITNLLAIYIAGNLVECPLTTFIVGNVYACVMATVMSKGKSFVLAGSSGGAYALIINACCIYGLEYVGLAVMIYLLIGRGGTRISEQSHWAHVGGMLTGLLSWAIL